MTLHFINSGAKMINIAHTIFSDRIKKYKFSRVRWKCILLQDGGHFGFLIFLMFFFILSKFCLHRDNVWYKSNYAAKNHQNPFRNDVSTADIVSKVKSVVIKHLTKIYSKKYTKRSLTFDTISAVETVFLDGFWWFFVRWLLLYYTLSPAI